LRDLAKELLKKKPELAKVKGLSYWKAGKIKHNKEMPLIEDLNGMPFVTEVYKKHLNIYDYFYAANLYPEVTILTGRGCPNRCVFCVLPQTLTGHGYRFRSVENVLKELEFIRKEFPQVKEVFIEDDTLTANIPRIRELCAKMIESKMNLIWSANARADVDLDTLKLMKKSGCRLLCVGIESGNQQILNNIKKGTTLEGIRRFFKATKQAGILVHGCFMLGNIGETVETLKQTIDFAKELDPDTAQFFPIMVYPGTEAYEYFESHDFITSRDFSEWLDEEGQHRTIVSRPGLSAEELVAWCDEARRQFYLRPKYIASKAVQALTNPRELKTILKSGKTFYKYVLKKPKK
ncbi:radical SAM protein, partial [archaeon]|nr:radical SAM protein [archaeon]